LKVENYIHFEINRTSSALSLCRRQTEVTAIGSHDTAQAVRNGVTSLPEICQRRSL